MEETKKHMEKAHETKISAIETAIDDLRQGHETELTEAEDKLQ